VFQYMYGLSLLFEIVAAFFRGGGGSVHRACMLKPERVCSFGALNAGGRPSSVCWFGSLKTRKGVRHLMVILVFYPRRLLMYYTVRLEMVVARKTLSLLSFGSRRR